MKQLQITFSKGGSFVADLQEEEARDNTRYLSNALPLSGNALHCMWSGQGIYTKLDDFPVNPGENHLMIGIQPGTVAIEYYPPHMRSLGPRTGIIITYGPNFLFRNPFGVFNQLLIVGRVRKNLDKLAEACVRVRRQGKEALRFEPVS